MQSDSTPHEESRNETKWLWVGACVLLIIMAVLLYLHGPARPRYSYVRARHILMKSNPQDPAETARVVERLRELRQRIMNGEDFGKLARQYSEDEFSAPRGGDLGISKKGQFDSKIDAYLWEGPVGEVSDVIRSSHGYHIVLIEERRLSEVDAHLKAQEEMLKERRLDGMRTPSAQAEEPDEAAPEDSTSLNSTSEGSE